MAARRRYDQDDGSGAAIVAIIAMALGFGGLIYGADQHDKRKQEEARFRRELAALRAALDENETALTDLAARLGPKNEKVRALAAEVERLRALLAQHLHAA